MIDLRHYDTILSPIVTEKSTLLSESDVFVFKVARDSTKSSIKAAVEALFGVNVKSINTSIRKGKTKRFKGVVGKQRDLKKAFVRLMAGQSIDVSSSL
ncbi:MAG: 50S ribosomal protein L23 [Alphaproteobacteria bacterium]|nr:50S ribosomal protein L23 [Alphaproteobacteria bacterium]